MFLIVTTMIHILEATTLHEGKPTCRVALTLQLVALAISDCFALTLAKLTQRLKVNTVIAEFLFHKSVVVGRKEKQIGCLVFSNRLLYQLEVLVVLACNPVTAPVKAGLGEQFEAEVVVVYFVGEV